MFWGLISVAGTPDRWREDDPSPAPRRRGFDISQLGMMIFLVSLAALFVPLLICCLILRSQAGAWPAPGMPALPGGYWVSTGLLLALSAALHTGLRRVRRNEMAAFHSAVGWSIALAIGFVLVQTLCWAEWFSNGIADGAWRFAAFLYFFMTIHVLHVIGGVVPLVKLAFGARRGEYGAANHVGVRNCVMYWHFIDAVWLVIFATMIIPG